MDANHRLMTIHLTVWRQAGPKAPGRFEEYTLPGVNEHMSFLEMLDVVNEGLIERGEAPIAFDSDCREGICGMCGVVINGIAHGPQAATTACQLHMRNFKDGQEIVIEPWRATAFPVIKDLVVDRSAFDRIVQAGGYISARTGSAPEANSVRVPKEDADLAMDAPGLGDLEGQGIPHELFDSVAEGIFTLTPEGAAVYHQDYEMEDGRTLTLHFERISATTLPTVER